MTGYGFMRQPEPGGAAAGIFNGRWITADACDTISTRSTLAIAANPSHLARHAFPSPVFSMHLIDRLYAIGKVRKTLWRHWYSFLTRRTGSDLLFLNYAYEDDSALRIPLDASDEPNRSCIQLYHAVAGQVEQRSKAVLEVSCGHGGGASYLMRTLRPERYTGLDLNPAGIRFCRHRHGDVHGLDFVQGDAEALPFPENSFDTVINVEASHCYASFPRFLSEAARVLKPGRHLLYADFRFAEDIAAWEQAIAAAPLRVTARNDISAPVLRGMARNSPRSRALVTRYLPKALQKFGFDFAGVKGSRVYRALESGQMSYRSYCFEKATNPVV
jgi:ubiquinone/menaquinone biosynthesis C-methylase UbiE